MKNIILGSILVISTISLVIADVRYSHSSDTEATSTFNSLKPKDCKAVTSGKLIQALGLDTVTECRAGKGWRLFKVNDEEEARSWIALARHGSVWTTSNEVLGSDYRFGHFPNIEPTEAEWRVARSGDPDALIFPVIAQKTDDSSVLLKRFYIISLSNKVPRFCGVAKTREAARAIADKRTTCTIALQENKIPK